MSGKEDRLNPEALTFKEKLYSETDKRWYAKMDQIRSEAGSFKSAAVGTGTLTTGLTITPLLTSGDALLSTTGMKFLLKEVIITCATAGVVSLWDGTGCTAATGTQKLRVRFPTTTAIAHGPRTIQLTDIHGCRFSSAVRYRATGSIAHIHVGGLRLVLQV